MDSTVPAKTFKRTGTALFHHTYHTTPYHTTPTITILTSATTIARQVTKGVRTTQFQEALPPSYR
jgi:hypothetical protein